MRTISRSLIHRLSVFTLLLGAFSQGAELQRYPWMTDLDEARDLASEQRKPMLIVFRCEP